MDRLGNVFECNPQVKLKKGNKYPLIDIDSITIGNKYPTPKEKVKYTGQSCSKFCNGDTIMARITPCLENGKIAMVKTDEEACLGSTELFVFRGKKDKSINEYVYYFMKQKWVKDYAANSMTGASGRQRASLEFIKKIAFKFPSCEIQKKIVEKLIKYDELLENNDKRIKLLEKMAQEIYKEWFVRFRFPSYKECEFYEGFPKEWKIKKYIDELNIVYGKGLPTEKLKEEGYPVFGSNGQIGFYDKYMYEKPQILISCRGVSSGVINISLPKSFITNNSLICEIDERTESIFEYLKYYFKNTNLVQFQTGSAQPQITINNIKNMKMVIPPIELQQKFSEIIKPIDEEILNLYNQNENLTKQRDLLLNRLMTGKIKVH